MSFQSTKIIDGFSSVFRQWKAEGTHCRFLHGYGVYFKVIFEGALDYRNWVTDFGFLKRSNYKITWPCKEDSKGDDHPHKEFTLKGWFDYMFDHTVCISEDDPALEWYKEGYEKGILQLRIVENVGCERFSELVYDVLSQAVDFESKGRVKVRSVECFEHAKNSAIYSEN